MPAIHTFPIYAFMKEPPAQPMNDMTHNLNTLRPRQMTIKFADDIFQCFFLNENVLI